MQFARKLTNNFNLFFFVMLLFFNTPAFSSKICQTEIRVNDPKAIISVDGNFIKTSHQFIACKDVPQNVIIVAPDKKPFVRVIPAASAFNDDENFWNVRLQSYADHAPVNQVLDLPVVSAEVGQLRSAVKNLKSGNPGRAIKEKITISETATSEKQIVEPVALKPKSQCTQPKIQSKNSSVITTKITLNKGNSPSRTISSLMTPVRHFVLETVPGTFFEIKAISKFKATPSQVINRLAQFKEKLAGIKITLCKNPESEVNYPSTLVLFGPIQDQQESLLLAQRLGPNLIKVQDPECEKNSKISFQFER